MITLNSATANNEDWRTLFQFSDCETGDLLDFTGAQIEIRVSDGHCRRIEASTDNGKIAIVSLGIFEIVVPATEMERLHAGMYWMGGVYQLNGQTISLFTGSLTIRNGIARL